MKKINFNFTNIYYGISILFMIFILIFIISLIVIINNCSTSKDSSLQVCFGLKKIINDSVNNLINDSTSQIENKLGLPLNEFPTKLNQVIEQLNTLNNSSLLTIQEQLAQGQIELQEINNELQEINNELESMNNKIDNIRLI